MREFITWEVVFSLTESRNRRIKRDIRDRNPVTLYYRIVIGAKCANQDHKYVGGCLKD